MNSLSRSMLLAQESSSWLAPFDFATQFAAYPPWITVPIVIFLVFVLPFLIGWAWAKWLRMPTYSWRIGLILCTVAASLVTIFLGWPPKLGVDLKGGYIMIYQIEDPTADGALQTEGGSGMGNLREETSNRGALIQQLKRRLNPDGLKEISIRPYGLNEIEIIVPETDKAEIEKLKLQIQRQGVLEFLIVAEQNTDSKLFEAARRQANDPALRRQAEIRDGDKLIGKWARVGREEKERGGVFPLRISGGWDSLLIRNSSTKEMMDSSRIPGGELAAARFLEREKIENLDVLCKVSEKYRVTGKDLVNGGVGSGIDENGFPEVNFRFKGASAPSMGGLTSTHIGRQLAIVLDDTLLSAANIKSQITDSGRITGRFTQEEVDFVIRILKAGSLPAKLRPEPVYEDPSDPTMGAENIRQGAWAIVISLLLVFVFCLGYYRLAGVVASVALLLNILLTVGVMILFGATLTMPGLAGLVLTVGMAVDANVLIFERMREELDKGASFRMAIRNGYDRAMSTIIDSNLTTLLTAVILYIIGTDQLVGFAVTLTLGLLISMFTAIFVTRVIFEILERTGTVRTLHFMHFLTNTKVDFVRYMGYSVVLSCVLIAIGLAAALYRGNGIFDIDLRGGSSVQVVLTKPLTTEEMHEYLSAAFKDQTHENSKVDYSLKPVGVVDAGGKHVAYRIDTIIPDTKRVQDLILNHLQEGGQSLLKRYQMQYDPPRATALGPADESEFFEPSGTEGKSGAIKPPDGSDLYVALRQESQEPDDSKAEAAKADESTDPPAAPEKSDQTEPKEEPSNSKAAGNNESGGPPGDAGQGGEVKAGETPADAGQPSVTTTIRFQDSEGNEEYLEAAAVQTRIEDAARFLKIDLPRVIIDHPEWDRDEATRRSEWMATLLVTPEDANRILQQMQSQISSEPVWPASKKIGGQIAGDFVRIAIVALLASLVGIIVYIWFRFQNVTWGFAAVVALIHDVLFMLAGIAVSYFIMKALPDGFLGLTEFKIDLTVIAAFLTLIGFSINDTIVIFDRMREIKGKLPNINRQIVNDSINQTLSRSFLTFLTVFVVVVVLYAFGGPGIHAFAYAMLIGTFVGMYSTVFIAAPFLLWMLNRPTATKKAA